MDYWLIADWLSVWLVNWKPCHLEYVGSCAYGASVYKIDYHVSGSRSVATNPDVYAYILNRRPLGQTLESLAPVHDIKTF